METSFGVDGSSLKLRYSGLRKTSARVNTRCSAGLSVFGGGSAATPAPAASPASIATAQRLHPKSRKSLRCHATVLPNGEADRRRTLMLKYVNECDPNEVQTFVDSAPPAVVSAMRHTVSNIVGSLPSAYFEVKVSTVADSLAQLFYTMAMTGYLFSSAQYRMELISSLNGGIAAPSSTTVPELATTAGAVPLSTSPSSSSGSSTSDDDASMSLVRSDSGSSASSSSSLSVMVLPDEAQYAPGVQKRDVQGQVLRWHNENGLEKMEAAEYMEHLEQQVVVLKEALAQQQQQQQRAGAWQERPLQGWPEMGVGSSGRGSATATAAAAASSPKVQFPSPATAGTSAAAAAAAAAAAGGSGELLDFLRSLPGDSLGELTSNACPEVLDAMDAFVSRLMGTSDKEQLRSMSSEFSATELSKVLIWLLVVGYALRTAEMRLEALSFRGDKPGGQGGGGTGGVLGLGGFGKSGPKNGGFGGWARFLPGR